MGSDADVEGVEDAIVTDELIDVDESAADEYNLEAGGDDAAEENGSRDDTDVKDDEQEQAQDIDSSEKVSRKRSRSRSKSPPESHEKDDFDDEELDSDVDETGVVMNVLTEEFNVVTFNLDSAVLSAALSKKLSTLKFHNIFGGVIFLW